MSKVFEDYFSEIHADMVDICLEYVNDKADRIFIYCSCESGAIFCDFFYCINGIIEEKHQINNALHSNTGFRYDTSEDRQFAVLDVLNEDVRKIRKLCQEYKREMPTEMKMTFDVKTHKFDAKYKYDLIHVNDPKKTAHDVAVEWLNEIKTICSDRISPNN